MAIGVLVMTGGESFPTEFIQPDWLTCTALDVISVHAYDVGHLTTSALQPTIVRQATRFPTMPATRTFATLLARSRRRVYLGSTGKSFRMLILTMALIMKSGSARRREALCKTYRKMPMVLPQHLISHLSCCEIGFQTGTMLYKGFYQLVKEPNNSQLS
ncbi:hypothetical protein A0H81_00342 [Grifola frondosa]|uniref:Uncharacterized protein n=1 Tax=Grifola frondosa TaxID=5627 RepID=A0A1C7MV31_GRIFR|nr:hypothetical protein A0H81_00342 [Grifola frondosa]